MKAKVFFLSAIIFFTANISGCEQSSDHSTSNELVFSKDSGIYEHAFDLRLRFRGAKKIFYTTDGSDPTTSDTRVTYKEGISITNRLEDTNVTSAVAPTLFCTNFGVYNSTDGLTCSLTPPTDDAVDKCTIIKAAAQDKQGSYTEVLTKTFFIGTPEGHIPGLAASSKASGSDLAVISITMEHEDLFDNQTGIYVKGDLFEQAFQDYLAENDEVDAGHSRELPANYNQRGREWERAAHIDVFEFSQDGAAHRLSQNCGIRIHGNYSRSDIQKGFRLYARSDYGEKNFQYKIFGDELRDSKGKVIDKFDTLVLRSGGNAALECKYNDAYWQTLSKSLDGDTKASRPCVVYLNGEYWGLYVLEEDYTDDFYEDHYGVNKDDVVVYKGGDKETNEFGYKLDEGELPDGETDTRYYYWDLLDFFAAHTSLENEEDYNEFAELVDVQSVMDYFAAQIWINNKWDWPGKNWSMWKTTTKENDNEYADGRWRFSFYDMEFGGWMGAEMVNVNTIKEDNYEPNGLLDLGTENPAVLCYAYLMTNENFRKSFNDRLLGLSEGIYEKKHALEVLTSFEDTYGPLLDQFFARYPESGSTQHALYGEYGTSAFIRDFLAERSDYIPTMVEWVNSIYE